MAGEPTTSLLLAENQSIVVEPPNSPTIPARANGADPYGGKNLGDSTTFWWLIFSPFPL
jgi:hypothetical protein